jgi:hypothetical protein
VFVALNRGALPARERSAAELYEWVRRDEEYAILGANVVVELNSEARARRSTIRARASIRRGDRSHRLASRHASRPTATTPSAAVEPTAPVDPTNPRSGRWRPMSANLTGATRQTASIGLQA